MFISFGKQLKVWNIISTLFFSENMKEKNTYPQMRRVSDSSLSLFFSFFRFLQQTILWALILRVHYLDGEKERRKACLVLLHKRPFLRALLHFLGEMREKRNVDWLRSFVRSLGLVIGETLSVTSRHNTSRHDERPSRNSFANPSCRAVQTTRPNSLAHAKLLWRKLKHFFCEKRLYDDLLLICRT